MSPDRTCVPRCAHCGGPLESLPEGRAFARLSVLCSECFGTNSYARKGRSWVDALYGVISTDSAEEGVDLYDRLSKSRQGL